MGLDPSVDYTSLDVVNRLLASEATYLAELARNTQIHVFLLKLAEWRDDSLQRKARGEPLLPPPVPPLGYTPPLPAPGPPSPPAPQPLVVLTKTQFGQYPAPGDLNPAGVVVDNPYVLGGKLRKVVGRTPFGEAHWWVEV